MKLDHKNFCDFAESRGRGRSQSCSRGVADAVTVAVILNTALRGNVYTNDSKTDAGISFELLAAIKLKSVKYFQ